MCFRDEKIGAIESQYLYKYTGAWRHLLLFKNIVIYITNTKVSS